MPSNTHYINEIDKDIKIDQVIIGSCTNGRYEDLVAAAEIFKGRKVAPFVRCIVIPGSQDVYDQAMKDGLLDIFIQTDCAVPHQHVVLALAVTWVSWLKGTYSFHYKP